MNTEMGATDVTAAATIKDKKPEQRSVPRQRVLYAGKIIYLGFAVQVDCTIRNVNEKGAKIFVPTDVSALPGDFYLLDVGKQSIVRAKIIWKRGNLFGVSFVSQREYVVDSPDPLIRRLRSM
jgi:hypothetical protein